MFFDVFADWGGTPQNRRPKVPQKLGWGCPVWRSFWVPMYLSQDTFRGTEFQYFSGYLPGGTFSGFRLPRVPQRGRFWLDFPHFRGSGRTCRNSTLSHAKPSFSMPGGVQNRARDPLFSKALFQEGPRAALLQILAISGVPVGPLGDHF